MLPWEIFHFGLTFSVVAFISCINVVTQCCLSSVLSVTLRHRLFSYNHIVTLILKHIEQKPVSVLGCFLFFCFFLWSARSNLKRKIGKENLLSLVLISLGNIEHCCFYIISEFVVATLLRLRLQTEDLTQNWQLFFFFCDQKLFSKQ